jgi:hypothetical protein
MKSKLTIDQYGTKRWRLPNGNLHREDGPACEYSGGGKWWYLNGQLHREDGPACEYTNGYKAWYINDREYTEQEYKYKIRSIKLKLLLH